MKDENGKLKLGNTEALAEILPNRSGSKNSSCPRKRASRFVLKIEEKKTGFPHSRE
jgi:hypothetical protein